MKDTQTALRWITDILKKHHVPFQIAGGLAAIAYGSTRELEDIDIDIPEEKFSIIKDEVESFITFGPAQFKSDSWDLLLMTLNYHGQDIDLSGAHTTKIYDKQNRKWKKLITDFSKVNFINLYGVDLPVIPREELIAYKTALARPVDLLDVKQLEGK